MRHRSAMLSKQHFITIKQSNKLRLALENISKFDCYYCNIIDAFSNQVSLQFLLQPVDFEICNSIKILIKQKKFFQIHSGALYSFIKSSNFAIEINKSRGMINLTLKPEG